ncbi:MAG: hypothetical protein KBB11_00130 [Bacteroidales bacterium]|nr:hypothetical protein [Bacteroidales bacterium]
MTFVLIAVFFLQGFLSVAQIYRNGLGVRIGETQGIIYKQFFAKTVALEAGLAFFKQGVNLTLIAENHHFDMFRTKNLYLFYGFGLHAGYFDGTRIPLWFPDDRGFRYYFVSGVDGIVGMEYTFEQIPVCIGLELKPAMNIIGTVSYWQGYAVSLKYIFYNIKPLQ